MTNRRLMPMASPSWRRTRAHRAWNVPAWTSRPPSPTRLMIRSRSSAAALLVNVTARIRHGRDVLDPDEVGDAMGEHAGLARAGAGQDEQRALGRGDGAGLLGVQGPDDLLASRSARRLARAFGSGVRRRLGPPGPARSSAADLAQPLGLVDGAVVDLRHGRADGAATSSAVGSCATASGGRTHRPILGRRPHPGPLAAVAPGPGPRSAALDLVGGRRCDGQVGIPVAEREVGADRPDVATVDDAR